MERRRFLQMSGAAAALGFARPGLCAPEASTVRTRPRPSAAQLAWQREELAMFVHLTVNTFTGKEWGMGDEDPSIFAPDRLDARQWARAAKAGGFGSMILTAKHHDGFCLWPTATTTHSVKSSPWRDGKGDVVREFVDACHAEGLGVGFYLSPWDRHEPRYGSGDAYNEYYIAQLTELLTQYGPVIEVWFDGANGEGPNGKRQTYDWPRIHATVRRLQPSAVIFSDAGPDVRWIGNEKGIADTICWSTVNPARVPHAGFDRPWVAQALGQGDPDGTVWRPGECDVSIRPGWFWHPEEDAKVRSADNLLGLYFDSVGRNGKLLLNVPPTRDGLFHENDVRALKEFADKRRALFGGGNLLSGARVRASAQAGGHAPVSVLDGDADSYWDADGKNSGWLEFESSREIEFDVIELQEAIAHGQNIANYRIEHWADGAWAPLAWGTTIGHKKLERIELVRARKLRLSIDYGYGPVRIAKVAVYRSAARSVSGPAPKAAH
ncbi:alpha-L-fucosidase [Luteimonas panaciterrae]|uniref:alpha-L-fucosidase n=1 Tax=Luteimonas panaciterrae TaxID=363885 RepID=UPI001CFC406C|nr:alpha-L-fucosidase [Luteimonas panaciterrae]